MKVWALSEVQPCGMRRPRSGTERSEPALEAAERAAAAAVAFFLLAEASMLPGLSLRLPLVDTALGSGSGCLRGLPLFRAYVCRVAPGVEAGVDAADEGAVVASRAGTASVELAVVSAGGIATAATELLGTPAAAPGVWLNETTGKVADETTGCADEAGAALADETGGVATLWFKVVGTVETDAADEAAWKVCASSACGPTEALPTGDGKIVAGINALPCVAPLDGTAIGVPGC